MATTTTQTEALPTAGTRLQGHTTLDEEIRVDALPVRGTLPDWLTGTFMRATPARFEVGEKQLGHWFDGLAMLNVFSIADGRVAYANRFLQTPRKLDAEQGRYRATISVGTDPCKRLGKRLMTMFDPDGHFEPNINIARFGERYFMATEAPFPLEFDPDTLDTLGFADMGHDSRDAHVLYDHMQFDPAEGTEMVTVVARLGVRNEHRIDAIDAQARRRPIGSAPAGRPPEYMHSFAMTEHYVVLPLQPLSYSLPGILRSGKFTECLDWHPEDGARFAVVDRRTGKVHSTHAAQPFFFWHTINAYEDGDEIVVDIVTMDSPQCVWDMEIEKLRDPDHHAVFCGAPTRYRLPLNGGAAVERRIADLRVEFPRINDSRNTFHYQYAYLAAYRDAESDWFDAVVKLDVDSGEHHEWHSRGATRASRSSSRRPTPSTRTRARC
ncbi:carotenoid oxygenase family protein [Patulibacter brassicae]|uniref:Dioxygenase n=1 Tax=Patulibacter brassicae TaxID=1705717 RepID=A0ABU4VN44_9ACTN|nr:carotenoid oxygenase family protein [Patulibacter brassicae]MDX8153280.1 carotenoid oxygenase family protein [Patulibacter brassicae]